MSPDTSSNDLIAALPQRERQRVLKYCEAVTIMQDEILNEAEAPLQYVYFPIDSVIALVTRVDERDALAVALIGSEGMLGATILLGATVSPLRSRVHGSGRALRMTVADFQRLSSEMDALEKSLLLYLYVLVTQIANTAACASFHVIEQRLAGWLLMCHDRAHADRFYLTHDRLAHMLGMRRSGVTTAAGLLHAQKFINYTRGHIVILDRKGLEQSACSCYRAMRNAFELLVPSVAASGETHASPAVVRPRHKTPRPVGWTPAVRVLPAGSVAVPR